MARHPIRFGVSALSEVRVHEIHEFLFPLPLSVGQEHILQISTEADFNHVEVGFSELGWPDPEYYTNS